MRQSKHNNKSILGRGYAHSFDNFCVELLHLFVCLFVCCGILLLEHCSLGIFSIGTADFICIQRAMLGVNMIDELHTKVKIIFRNNRSQFRWIVWSLNGFQRVMWQSFLFYFAESRAKVLSHCLWSLRKFQRISGGSGTFERKKTHVM